jgi:cellulose biosynthesis protein BcsQ
VWHLAAALALRGKRIRIEDLDQGAHLSRVFHAHPLGLDNLQLGGNAPADLVILDTAPEAGQARALEYLRRSDWVLVPVKGPEEDSVQVLPMLMGWIRQVGTARLIGFVPTMHNRGGPHRSIGSASSAAWQTGTLRGCLQSTTWLALPTRC